MVREFGSRWTSVLAECVEGFRIQEAQCHDDTSWRSVVWGFGDLDSVSRTSGMLGSVMCRQSGELQSSRCRAQAKEANQVLISGEAKQRRR